MKEIYSQEGVKKKRMEHSEEMERPVIGVLGNLYTHTHSAYAAQMTYANSAYLNAVSENGGIPFVIPAVGTEEELERLLSFCDGLLFPGGEDVDPKLFGEEPHPSIGSVNEQMDRFWILAEKKAEERKLPVLGICRGMQLVNVARGGSLWQDISLYRADHQLHAQKQERSYPIHQVRIEKGSRLSKILGEETVYTNTLHHQCVRLPGRDLAVTAWAVDGVAEAMESPEGRIVLVQWHPEELTRSVPKMNGLFSDLVRKAQRHRCEKQQES
ncbi:MAG TPA: gamma-glutamyl-gamma-aminobutyrate hydrolase family protein [Lacrimispora saccharolytica]|nr:gamma-glutamyl-gamma-aminobutyrate hydrolase family protein [Clostridium sp. M62/1]HJG83653.1 gamma-glutamyl-gamma-aminobutyrate hydrolase family protein [Lacrimispora saccharolytica]